jgi:predicted Ser/Thr protein kinase
MSDEPRCPQCGAPLPPESSPGGLCPQCLMKAGLESTGGGSERMNATVVDPPPLEEIAKEFPHLEILQLLGRGGMGIVYKARQPHLDRLVALKILPAQRSGDPAYHERFAREARALARLNHPHIVGIHDFGQTPGGRPYFLMEFVDGVNLREALRAGHLSPQQALAIVPQICDALQFAHDEGIVHRDIKPENVLLDKRGRVKIADFGIAKILGRDTGSVTLTQTGQSVGTPRYMAPEQLDHPEEVDHRADIYSLGVVFYEMLTGELPMGRFAPPSKRVHVDVRLDEVVLRALEREPERRYQQASEVKTRVETIAGSPGAAPPPPHAVYRRWRHRMLLTPGREHLKRALFAAGLLVFLGFWNLADLPGPPGGGEGGPGWAQIQLLLRAFAWVGLVVAILSRRIASIGLTVEEQQHIADLRRRMRQTGTPRALIWGITLPVIAMSLLVALMLWRRAITPPGSTVALGGPSWVVLVLLGPVLMTACGLIGLSMVQRSRVRRPGLALALFESLFVPLAILDGLIVWALEAIAEAIKPTLGSDAMLAPALLVCLVVNILLMRWARRAARRAHPSSTGGGRP